MSSTPCCFACSRRASMRSTISSRLEPSLLGPIWAAATMTLRAIGSSPLGDAELGDFLANEALDLALEGHEGGARAVARMENGHVHDLLDGAGMGGHDHDAVREEDRLRDAVGDEDHCLLVLFPDAEQFLLHHLARLRIEGAEGLVHEKHRGLIGEHARDGHPLFHAARELARILLLVLGEPDQGEIAAGHRASLRPGQALDHGAELHVLDGGAPGKERVLLEHHPAVGPGLGHLVAVHEDVAGGRLDEACDHVEERGLATAGWAEETGEAVLRQLQAHLVESEGALDVALRHTLDLDRLHASPRAWLRQRRSRPSSLRRRTLASTPMTPITAAPRSMLETRKNVRASLMRKPRPESAAMNSAATMTKKDSPKASRSPVMMFGVAAGSTTCQKICRSVAPRLAAARMSTGSTYLMPSMVVVKIGKNAA